MSEVYTRVRIDSSWIDCSTPMAYATFARFDLGLDKVPLPRCFCTSCGAEKLLYLAEHGGTVCTECGVFFKGEPEKWIS